MEIRYPKYYQEFKCIAAACLDSCCQEWEVVVDPESAARYRALPGQLGDRLRQVLRDDAGETYMTIEDRRCPMWRQDGLCQIQAELGHGALCKTCREFPRLRHNYGVFVELGLELSCPEAARLILQDPEPGYLTETAPGGEAEYDVQIMHMLLRSRDEVLEVLRDPMIPVGYGLAAMLLYGYEIHEALEDPGSMPSRCESHDYIFNATQLARDGSMQEIFSLFRTLEILTPDWQQILDAGPGTNPWLPQHRALACYLIDRYWLQAISDLDLLCRVKFIAVSCLMVRHLAVDPLRAAQLWSKEIENDADNVDALLDAAYFSPALADVKLLDLLLR